MIMLFESILKKKYKIDPSEYMSIARKRADGLGYTGELKFADDGQHKLEYDKILFGNVDNKDYIIYLLTEGKEKAEKMRRAYRARMFADKPGRTITKKMRLTSINW